MFHCVPCAWPVLVQCICKSAISYFLFAVFVELLLSMCQRIKQSAAGWVFKHRDALHYCAQFFNLHIRRHVISWCWSLLPLSVTHWCIYYTSSIILSSIMKFPLLSHSTYFVLPFLFRHPSWNSFYPSITTWNYLSQLAPCRVFCFHFLKKMWKFYFLILSAHFKISYQIIL
jgi:hypothetical protein